MNKNFQDKSLSIMNLGNNLSNVRNVDRYMFGKGSLFNLKEIINKRQKLKPGLVIFFIDSFFKSNGLPINFTAKKKGDIIIYVDASEEPTTNLVNEIKQTLAKKLKNKPSIIVGIGGGSTMDIAKAISNLLTNKGKAEDYQGWDLLKNKSIYKIGIPTISGTGAESTRTCVMINKKKGLKLGMNSDYTVFDQVILDPDLTKTVPKNQFFWTGMDSYIHCVESLSGRYRNPIGDAFSNQAIKLCREVFLSKNMQNNFNREKLMIASYLGGCAIATSFVGLIHPLSSGLSVVLGTHHCISNCIVLAGMKDFYPSAHKEFMSMLLKQRIKIPKGISNNLTTDQYEHLYNSTMLHEKPLINALGKNYKKILTKKKVTEIFKSL